MCHISVLSSENLQWIIIFKKVSKPLLWKRGRSWCGGWRRGTSVLSTRWHEWTWTVTRNDWEGWQRIGGSRDIWFNNKNSLSRAPVSHWGLCWGTDGPDLISVTLWGLLLLFLRGGTEASRFSNKPKITQPENGGGGGCPETCFHLIPVPHS